MHELITIVEDSEYENSFIIIINRFPDKLVRCSLNSNKYGDCEIDRMMYFINNYDNADSLNKFHIFNYFIETKRLMDYYCVVITIPEQNVIESELKLFDVLSCSYYDEKIPLTQLETNELVNKLIDIYNIRKDN